MDFSFFTTDNKSGYKTSEKWISKNHPDLYTKIISYSNDINLTLSFKEKIWFYFNNLTERPKCVTCNGEIKFRERFDKPYGDFCSLKCINENKNEMIERQKKTFNEKYGVDFFPQHNSFIDKVKETNLERYGVDNYTKTEECQEKMKKTNLERYGVDYYTKTEECKERIKRTNIERYGSPNYTKSNEYKDRINNEYKNIYPDLDFIVIDKLTAKIKCFICNEIYEISKQLIYERAKRNQEVCTKCNPIGQYFQSSHEDALCSFLDSINVKYERSVKILESKESKQKQEIDIMIPSKGIGIEINGLYWHSELFRPDPKYHLNKTIKAKSSLDIDLLHIFEDEWLYKKEIVKSIIRNRLGMVDNIIYARKCKVMEISHDMSKDFLDNNHIQGNVNSRIRLGLFYNDKLVSVMTFSNGRIIMGGKSDEYELTRFSNIINTIVIGAASKLFKYFLDRYKPNKVISYSDIRLFSGSMYEKLGFDKVSQSKPSYWYVKNGNRYYRFNFRKSILVKEGYDSKMTEAEIMRERGYLRIYDCGNIRWEYNVIENDGIDISPAKFVKITKP